MITIDINDSEKEKIYASICNESSHKLYNLKSLDKEQAFQLLFSPIWLNVKWHYNCYYFYAEYYFEAWTTSTADPNGPRVSVDQIEIYWRHNDARGHEVRNNADMVAKDDRVYSTGTMCDTDMCISGRATHKGITWGVNNPDLCIP